ncbi:MAG TPA: hypothetical protein EYN66_18465 [Myxococcales bacterium]|nr:hypothetical protein [Myxococcales bacterium]
MKRKKETTSAGHAEPAGTPQYLTLTTPSTEPDICQVDDCYDYTHYPSRTLCSYHYDHEEDLSSQENPYHVD